MKKIFTLMVAAAMVFGACKKDAPAPTLTTDKTDIPAAYTAGNYSIAVTSNTAWTVAVTPTAATWCVVSLASGNGNGTVNVTVAENPAVTSRSATVTVTAGALAKTITVTQAAADPALSVDKTAIPAAYTAGNYSIAVTSNTAWTVAVTPTAATWCVVSPASDNGNGTVNVTVAENTAVTSRSATVTVTAGALAKTITVTQAAYPTPTYAASTQTWTFGDSPLIWSDAIQIPECNKTSFTANTATPQCRSYTDGANTWYYYNWPYVNSNAASLCPSLWRVPTTADFAALVPATTYTALAAAWGFGGYADNSLTFDHGTYGAIWSSLRAANTAQYLYYSNGTLTVRTNNGAYGLQVRCVR